MAALVPCPDHGKCGTARHDPDKSEYQTCWQTAHNRYFRTLSSASVTEVGAATTTIAPSTTIALRKIAEMDREIEELGIVRAAAGKERAEAEPGKGDFRDLLARSNFRAADRALTEGIDRRNDLVRDMYEDPDFEVTEENLKEVALDSRHYEAAMNCIGDYMQGFSPLLLNGGSISESDLPEPYLALAYGQQFTDEDAAGISGYVQSIRRVSGSDDPVIIDVQDGSHGDNGFYQMQVTADGTNAWVTQRAWGVEKDLPGSYGEVIDAMRYVAEHVPASGQKPMRGDFTND